MMYEQPVFFLINNIVYNKKWEDPFRCLNFSMFSYYLK